MRISRRSPPAAGRPASGDDVDEPSPRRNAARTVEQDPDGETPAQDLIIRPSARSKPPPADDRPLTLQETLDLIRAYLHRIQGTRRELGFTVLAVAVLGLLGWAVVSVALPWAEGGVVGSVQGLLALDLPWTPLPPPDDPRVAGATNLAAAAWVGAPLVLGVFWFTAAYHLDRTSRRAFRVLDAGAVRQTPGYTVVAVGLVFPLIMLGLAASAWGVFALLSWASASQAWTTVGMLVGLLLAFAGTVRLANALLDRRFDR